MHDSFDDLFDFSDPDDERYEEIYPEYQPIVALWLVKLALFMKWYEPRRSSRTVPEIFNNANFCHLTGIEQTSDQEVDTKRRYRKRNEHSPELFDEEPPNFKKILQKRLKSIPKQKQMRDLTLFKNIRLLGEMLSLDDCELFLLTFTAALDLFKPFRDAIGDQNLRTGNQLLCQLLACLSGLPEAGFRQILGEDGVLVSSGVVKICRPSRDLEDKLRLIDGLSGILLMTFESAQELVDQFVRRAPEPTLTLENFPHLEQETAVLLPYLRNTVRDKTAGVNVLLHGKPGVGKSEYVQALAAQAGLELYEISFADEDGDQLKGEGRLRAFSLCQRLLARNTNAMLVFDEIEDVFPSSGSAFMRMLFGGRGGGNDSAGKAWINRTLEHNPVPAVWISNEISQIDPAYLRRFDFSVAFPTPPTTVRLSIAEHHFGGFSPSEDFLQRIAANEETTPAQLDRAAKVARIVSEGNREQAIELIDLTLEKSSLLLNQKMTPSRNIIRTGFSLDFLNTDTDITLVVDGLKRRPRGTFCFYGAAGTGKSELARHLSDVTGKPLLVKRASDILSQYLGATEKKIAQMFAEARRQDAVLVLDEADSFLSDRRNAQRSWEVTQVNELLTQMEAFEGIFICTTNLLEKIDPASLRRFAFKVRFNPLLPEQRWKMFMQELQRLGGAVDDAGGYRSEVTALDYLTPGDFAVAAHQFELWGVPATAARLLEQLRNECTVKGASPRKIGFVC